MRLGVGLPVVAILAASLALPASAQQSAPALSTVELAERFAAGDINRDGKLEKLECLVFLSEAAKPRADMIWSRIDPEGKGFVTKDVFLAANGKLGGRPAN
jgi:hypothetical protein